jgi:outer membrane biosynthesis protein TonB
VPLHKSALLTLPHREVTHEVLIDVKVYVNPSGKVEYSELVSRVPKTESDLASLVVFSARRWEFEPAREGKDAVAGEVVLHYRFGPGGRASAR